MLLHDQRGVVFHGGLPRIAQRFEQARPDKDGNVMRLEVESPRGLLRIEAGDRVGPMLVEGALLFVHVVFESEGNAEL